MRRNLQRSKASAIISCNNFVFHFTIERDVRKSAAGKPMEENFCLTYDSDEDNKAKKLSNVSSMAQQLKLKKATVPKVALSSLE